MDIQKNSRQIPSTSTITREKDYCDLLYAWLQCNSERESLTSSQRRIEKSKVKWTAIERDFVRVLSDGTEEKVMARKTIAKYFNYLLEKGLVYDGKDSYYYLTVLNASEANLIEYNTFINLINVLYSIKLASEAFNTVK